MVFAAAMRADSIESQPPPPISIPSGVRAYEVKAVGLHIVRYVRRVLVVAGAVANGALDDPDG